MARSSAPASLITDRADNCAKRKVSINTKFIIHPHPYSLKFAFTRFRGRGPWVDRRCRRWGHSSNSILLYGILARYQAAGNQKALELLKRISPVAWQHIHFLGHYTFRDKQHPIDLEAILASVNLQ